MTMTITQYSVFENIFKKLQKLIPDLTELKPGEYRKSKVEGYMDLVLEVLGKSKKNDYIIISLTHYYIQNLDLMRDPDMSIKVYLNEKMKIAEALTFIQDGGIPINQEVYFEQDGKKMFYPKLRKELNHFLNSTWLKNLINQGHNLTKKEEKTN